MTPNDSADIPVYLRLRGMLAAAILEGKFAEGDQLPSVRSFAADHGANPLTVAKAYQALQDDGYVTVRRGVDRLRVQERETFMTRVWPRIRAHIERLGIDPAELVARETA